MTTPAPPLLPPVGSPTQLSDFRQMLEGWWTEFAEAYIEYGPGAADETGLAGQWADLHRKVRKLKRLMWEGEEGYLSRESEEEILRDIISHAFLAMEMLRRVRHGERSLLRASCSGQCSSSPPQPPMPF